MCIMAVYTAVGQESPQMQIRALFDTVVDCLVELRVCKEISVLDHLGDLGKILIDDTAGAHIHMAHLGVAHLTVGKTDCHSGSVSFNKRTLCHQFFHHGSLSHSHRICFFDVGETVAVKDHQYNRFLSHVCFLSVFRNYRRSSPSLKQHGILHIFCPSARRVPY